MSKIAFLLSGVAIGVVAVIVTTVILIIKEIDSR